MVDVRLVQGIETTIVEDVDYVSVLLNVNDVAIDGQTYENVTQLDVSEEGGFDG